MVPLFIGTALAIAAVCYVVYPLVVRNDRKQASVTMACAKCGTQLREGTSFCANCGEPVASGLKSLASDI